MGVLNVTPDSFSDGGRFLDVKAACSRALQMQSDGADIIDIGGESTRPGSLGVSAEQEIARILPVLKRLKGRLRIPISVDTAKPEVAEAALKQGASIINGVTGLHGYERLAQLCATYSAGLVIMHMKGTPRTMQKNPTYRDLLGEIKRYLKEAIALAVKCGVKKENIVIDPGIGFGKRLCHNLKILKELYFFKKMGVSVLIGLSRKSFLGVITGRDVTDRTISTVSANAIAVYNGADIIRVHDIKEAILTTQVADAIGKVK